MLLLYHLYHCTDLSSCYSFFPSWVLVLGCEPRLVLTSWIGRSEAAAKVVVGVARLNKKAWEAHWGKSSNMHCSCQPRSSGCPFPSSLAGKSFSLFQFLAMVKPSSMYSLIVRTESCAAALWWKELKKKKREIGLRFLCSAKHLRELSVVSACLGKGRLRGVRELSKKGCQRVWCEPLLC